MNIRLVWASVAGVLALAAPAFAHTVNCSEDSDRLQDNLSRLERGSTLTIKGNCVGNVTVATDGVSLVAHKDGGSITGQVEVTAQRVKFTGISILGPEPSDPDTIVRAGLFARDGASVSVITGNGTANVANSADGVQAADGGTVMLGTPDANNDPVPSAAVEVAHNGFRGILAVRGGSARLMAANVHDNGAQAAVASFNGAMRITGGSLSAPTPASGTPADVVIAAFGGAIDIENDTGNPISNTTITGGSGGVIALDSGAARLRGVSITTSGGSNLDPSAGAFRSASIRLQGANTIANVNTLGGGFAVEIGDSASLRVDDGSGSGFPSGSNVITGPWQVFDAGQARIADAGLGSG